MKYRSTRRQALRLIAAGLAGAALGPTALHAASGSVLARPIPSTRGTDRIESIPVIGMGTCPPSGLAWLH